METKTLQDEANPFRRQALERWLANAVNRNNESSRNLRADSASTSTSSSASSSSSTSNPHSNGRSETNTLVSADSLAATDSHNNEEDGDLELTIEDPPIWWDIPSSQLKLVKMVRKWVP